jgi:hypothetical protein
MAGEEAAMAFGGRACSMTTVHCGATPPAHPLEKSALGFEDTSIYRLSRQQIEKSRFIADSSPSAVMEVR